MSSILIKFISSHYLPEVNCLYFYFLALHKNTVSCPVSVFVTLVHSENWIIFRKKLGKNTNKPSLQPKYIYVSERKKLTIIVVSNVWNGNYLRNKYLRCDVIMWGCVVFWYPPVDVWGGDVRELLDTLTHYCQPSSSLTAGSNTARGPSHHHQHLTSPPPRLTTNIKNINK